MPDIPKPLIVITVVAVLWFAVNQTVTFVGKVNATVGKVHKSNEIQQQNFQQTMSQDFRRSQKE